MGSARRREVAHFLHERRQEQLCGVAYPQGYRFEFFFVLHLQGFADFTLVVQKHDISAVLGLGLSFKNFIET